MILRTTLLAAAALLAAAPAFAQTPAPKPAPTTIPEEIAPGAKPTEPAKNLSQKLDQSNGVIHPKDVDPMIDKTPPKTGDPDVVRPPWTNGGGAAPQVK